MLRKELEDAIEAEFKARKSYEAADAATRAFHSGKPLNLEDIYDDAEEIEKAKRSRQEWLNAYDRVWELKLKLKMAGF